MTGFRRAIAVLSVPAVVAVALACGPKQAPPRPIPARVPIPGPFDAAAAMVASGTIIAEGNEMAGRITPAKEEMKNVPAMGDVPVERFMTAMLALKGAIGADCKECHPTQNYESDEPRPKLKARQMIRMSTEINEVFFERQARVTCYTCHRGKWSPEQEPSLADRMRAAKHPVPQLTEDQQFANAETVFKNVQSFKGRSAKSMMSAMSLWTAAVGVECTYCHTEEGKWEQEDVVQKDVTRAMVAMTDRINQKYFAGEPVMTCWGCHRGLPIPERQAPEPDPGVAPEVVIP